MKPHRETGRVTIAARRYGVWIPIIGVLTVGHACYVRSVVRDEFDNQRKLRAARQREAAVAAKQYEKDQADIDRQLQDHEKRLRDLERDPLRR